MTLFPEWQEQHKDQEPGLPPRIKAMLSFYGRYPDNDKTCKLCVHLLRFHQSARRMKCDLSKMSQSIATDWRAGWPACKKYKEK